MKSLVCVLLLLALSANQASAYYLPGIAAHSYTPDEEIPLLVEALDSVKTQLHYNYYSLPFCKGDGVHNLAENLGQVLAGQQIDTSDYKLVAQKSEKCKVLCRKVLTKDEIALFRERITEDYVVNMQIDNLPAATSMVRVVDGGPEQKFYVKGFPLGAVHEESKKVFLHNHLKLVVLYHPDDGSMLGSVAASLGTDTDENGIYVVGFEVEPSSVKHTYNEKWPSEGCIGDCKLNTCPYDSAPIPGAINTDSFDESAALEIPENQENLEVIFSYDVVFKESETKWASRWDLYLQMTDDDIHWFSIVNSLLVVIFLTGMVAMIIIRVLRRDINRYNQYEMSEEIREESGWKLVFSDVFRPPVRGGLLAVFIGTGSQFLGMTFVILSFALLGFLSPANRGVLLSFSIAMYFLLGFVAGYSSTRFWKTFGGKKLFVHALLTALLIPGTIFGIIFFMNFFIWSKGSSDAIPFGTMVALIVLLLFVSTPLTVFGAVMGNKRDVLEFPARVSPIPREIPPQPTYLSLFPSALLGGLLPFGAVFVEMFFILSSIWLHRFYYLFGFVFLVFVILAITCVEISIVIVYFQLCSEDYKWWWRSFITPAFSAVYFFLYSIYYFTSLEVTGFQAGLLYIGYSSIAAILMAVTTGTIGFLGTFIFVKKIYGAVKAD